MRRRALWATFVTSCLITTGCSVMPVARLGYENLPTLATWRADSYLSLSAEQRALAAQRIAALHAWHRSTQLDDYGRFLREVRQELAGQGVDEARIRGWRQQLFERWIPIADQAAPGVAAVAATLDAAQLERLRQTLEQDNDALRRRWLPAAPGERTEARYRRYVERAESFLGPLTAQQKQLARRMAAEAPDTEERWYAQRLERQRDLLALMDRIRTERPDAASANRWVRDHLRRYAPTPDGTDRQVVSSLAAGDAMSAAMLAIATPRQRQHLDGKLRDWIDLVDGLRATAAATPVVPTRAPIAASAP